MYILAVKGRRSQDLGQMRAVSRFGSHPSH